MSGRTCEICGANTPYTDWTRCERHNTRLAEADRIAALEAELADANAQLADVEFAAYTDALAEARKERDAAAQSIMDLQHEMSDMQADAAALRLAVEPAFEEYVGRGEEPVSLEKAFAVFRDMSAGRALADRVKTLEADAAAIRCLLVKMETKLLGLDAAGRTDYDRIVNGCNYMVDAIRTVLTDNAADRALSERVMMLEADASAMREALTQVVNAIDRIPTNPKMFARQAAITLVMLRGECAGALSSNDAGRVLAERMTLLEAVARNAQPFRQMSAGLRNALVALDAKDGG